jgi:hypothetical protein
MYRWHKQKNWSLVPESRAFGFISAIHIAYIVVFSLFISNCIRDLFFENTNFWTIFLCVFWGWNIVDFVWIYKRYNEKRIAVLEKKYRKDWRNKVIGNWMILMAFPLSFPCAWCLCMILFARQIHILEYRFSGFLWWMLDKFGLITY